MTREQELLERWRDRVEDAELAAELETMAEDPQATKDAFYQDLEFGTAGLRGILGAGTDRMNIHTVGRATQGFADYLKANFEDPTVVIGRDSRNKGDEFVRRTAEVFAANGVKAYVFPRIVPTPAVSFAIRDLGSAGGVNVTASHNPAPYNGYKAYGPDGCQIVTEAAEAISDSIADTDIFDDVRTCDFDEALEAGTIAYVEEETLDRFLDAVAACSVATDADREQPLKLVYTPLNGTGLECVTRILEHEGITDIAIVEEQAQPDGNFPTCPYPNPEMREALQKAIDLAEQVHPDLLLATDPDADRVGIGVKSGDDYRLLSGNEVGVLLLDYLARKTIEQGGDPTEKVAVTTIVSSAMVDALAEEYGFEVRRVLTGFKYIGELIAELEAQGREDRFLFGFEESYGYLNGTDVRDKDAIDATMLICQMAQDHKSRGKDLGQAMDELYERFGYYENKTLSFSYPGAEGSERMGQIMSDLRNDPPARIADLDVEEVLDYQQGINGLPASNVLEFRLQGGQKMIVRPSGTEPKIKAYLFARDSDKAAAQALLGRLEAAAQDLLA